MRIKDWRRITLDDISEAPEWFQRAVDSLNDQIEDLTTALQLRLTLSENLYSEVRTLELAHDVSTDIRLQKIRTRPLGLLVLATDYYEYHRAAMEVVDRDLIRVKIKWDVAPSSEVAVTLAIFGT